MSDSPDHYLFLATADAQAANQAIWTALRLREIPTTWATVLHCLLWQCRRTGRDRSAVSISTLRAKTRVQRQSVVDALQYAHDRGWLTKVTRRIRVWCDALKHHVVRQTTTLLVWRPRSEYTRQTVLSVHIEEERRMLRRAAKKARASGVMPLAITLTKMERENPAMLVLIGEAITKSLRKKPAGATRDTPTWLRDAQAFPMPSRPVQTPAPLTFVSTVAPAEPAYNQSLINHVRSQRFARSS